MLEVRRYRWCGGEYSERRLLVSEQNEDSSQLAANTAQCPCGGRGTDHFVSRRRSWRTTSAWTLGVAVAVTAMMGTSGNLTLSSLRRL